MPSLLALVVVALVVVAALRLALGAAGPPPTAEQRDHSIGERLACPICQGLSVADSPSALAGQMRAVIAEQVAAGRSDAQIEQYFVDRYGPAILLTPPKQGFTLLVWWIPIVVIVASGAGLALAALRWTRRPAPGETLPALTDDEERRYAAKLADALSEISDESPKATVNQANQSPARPLEMEPGERRG